MFSASLGVTPGGAPYIEDVFSTYLYAGNSASQTINNGLNVANKGGLVWIKNRTANAAHILQDTNRGANIYLSSDAAGAQSSVPAVNFIFNSDGFSQNNAFLELNAASNKYVSWSFLRTARFFDVVTYTGTGVSNLSVSHSLGSVPGVIFVKRTDTNGDWQVYHRSLGPTKYAVLNSTAAEVTSATRWNNTFPSASVFTLGDDATVNAVGGTYVAYLFAHDSGGFGENFTDNVVTCSTYVGNGSTAGPTIVLGYEPQWVLIKRVTGGVGGWVLFDSLRGLPVDADDVYLYADAINGEGIGYNALAVNALGFQITNGIDPEVNQSGDTYIFMAVRRGPMKPPTSGLSVFYPGTYTGTGSPAQVSGVGFTLDLVIPKNRNIGGTNNRWTDRLRGANRQVISNSSASEATLANEVTGLDSMDGFFIGAGTDTNQVSQPYISWIFQRASLVFDVVCYTGTGAAATVPHSVGAVPELIFVKSRSASYDWWVYDAFNGNTQYQVLNSTAVPVVSSAAWNDTSPTSSVFFLGTGLPVNASGSTYVAYLFASYAGVSKVGNYTGTGATLQINCGFASGARFILIKRTDSTGEWYVWDSARGITSGSDPWLALNSTAAENASTDWVDVYSLGFELSNAVGNNVNISSATYIFLAIA